MKGNSKLQEHFFQKLIKYSCVITNLCQKAGEGIWRGVLTSHHWPVGVVQHAQEQHCLLALLSSGDGENKSRDHQWSRWSEALLQKNSSQVCMGQPLRHCLSFPLLPRHCSPGITRSPHPVPASQTLLSPSPMLPRSGGGRMQDEGTVGKVVWGTTLLCFLPGFCCCHVTKAQCSSAER